MRYGVNIWQALLSLLVGFAVHVWTGQDGARVVPEFVTGLVGGTQATMPTKKKSGEQSRAWDP